MPAYEVLVMAKAAVQRGELVDVVRGLAQRVIKDGGVVMAVKSYGTVRLAYDVKKRDGWHQQGQVVQVEVNAPASLAQQLEHLNKDERLLRWLLLKRRPKRWMTWRGEAMQSATMPPPRPCGPRPLCLVLLPGLVLGSLLMLLLVVVVVVVVVLLLLPPIMLLVLAWLIEDSITLDVMPRLSLV
ncbi:hypothetical protein CLOP_g20911 [Closterium sp. NIES-67]|nr:hypothetical protein CLOP_g20911 [Closterium sp. NIES-67]